MAQQNAGKFVLSTDGKTDEQLTAEALNAIADIYRASQSCFWKGIAIAVALAVIASAVFAGLTYFCK